MKCDTGITAAKGEIRYPIFHVHIFVAANRHHRMRAAGEVLHGYVRRDLAPLVASRAGRNYQHLAYKTTTPLFTPQNINKARESTATAVLTPRPCRPSISFICTASPSRMEPRMSGVPPSSRSSLLLPFHVTTAERPTGRSLVVSHAKAGTTIYIF